MKKSTLLLVCILYTAMTYGQKYDWGITLGSADNDYIGSMTTDNNNDVISTGYFSNTIDFDPGSGTQNFTAVGSTDLFIQKHDATGKLLWVKTIGRSGSGTAGLKITSDPSGNIYVVGSFNDSLDIDPGTGVHKVGLSLNYNSQYFIAKYTANGDFIWGHSITELPTHPANYFTRDCDLSIDKNGNFLYFAYSYLQGNSVNQINVTKINTANGTALWDNRLYGTQYIVYPSIAVDGNNNVLVSGSYNGRGYFDPKSNSSSWTSGGINTFVVKLDSNSNLVFQRQLFAQECYDVAVDQNNDIILAGRFSGTLDFDPGPAVHNLIAGSSFGSSMYITKFSSTGNFIWATGYGDNSTNYVNAITTDINNNIYATGLFRSATFSHNPYIRFQGKNATDDGFLIKLNSQGYCTFGQHFAGSHIEYGSSLHVNKSTGEVYVAGAFDKDIDLEENTTGSTYFVSKGEYDTYMAKFSSCDPINTNVTISGITLTAVENNATYQWLDCATGLSMTNATGQSFTPTVNGTYSVVIIKNKGACFDTSNCITISDVSVEDVDQQVAQVYPNPTSGKVSIKLGAIYNDVEVNITSVTGKEISNTQYSNTDHIETQINAATGVYFVTIKSKGKVIARKYITKQ